MESIHNQEVGFKPDKENRAWHFDNLTAARIGPIFGGRTISAMGNRPQDHMARDLLLASLIRDRRLRMFRKQCLTPPEWAPAVPANIPANFRNRAQQLIMLGCNHQHLIEKMRASIDLAADPCHAERMLKAIEACPPRGALFTRPRLDNARPCGHARLCPWCHARSVERFYEHLLAGPCTPERLAGKYLIAFRTRLEAGEDLQSGEVRKARNDYRYRLRRVAHKIGIEGGAIIHQVTPWIPHYDRPHEKKKGFAHIFTLIGVSASTIDGLGVNLDELCSDLWLDWDYEAITLPADTPQALRYLLFGSSYKFDSSHLGIVVNDWKRLRYGIQGAAALEPWFLFDERQAWSYANAIQGLRLYDTFGNWHKSQAERKQCSRKRRAKSEYGNENRTAAFDRKNDQRRSDANSRRRKLAKLALPYYQKFKDAGGKRLGRPALRKVMQEAGYPISDRDARWLAKNLPAMDTRTWFDKSFAKWKLDRGSRFREGCQAAEEQINAVACNQA